MDIEEQRKGAVTVVRPVGPLCAEDVEQFKRRLTDVFSRSLGRLIIDASAIPFVDSPGLEALVQMTETASRSGQSLKLCRVNETLREVLDLTDLANLFESFEDENAAVRSFL